MIAFGVVVGLVGGIQFLWIFLHTGQIGVYDKALDFSEIRTIPNIELIAYSLPEKSAYIAKLDTNEVSRLTHFCLKIKQGLFAYRPAVYLGFAPTDHFPMVIHVKKSMIVHAYILSGLFVGACLWGAAKLKGSLGIMILVSLAGTLFTFWYVHVENRYYVAPKILLLAVLLYGICRGLDRLLSRNKGGSSFSKSWAETTAEPALIP